MQYRFKGFTEKANTALNLSIRSAQALGHTYVGTEHLLLGLLREGSGVAAVVLNNRGITAAEYERRVAETEAVGAYTYVTPQDFTPRAKAAMEKAAEETAKAQYGYIGTEHLLLALLQDKSCIGMRILQLIAPCREDLEKELRASYKTGIELPEKRAGKEAGKSALHAYGKDLTALAQKG